MTRLRFHLQLRSIWFFLFVLIMGMFLVSCSTKSVDGEGSQPVGEESGDAFDQIDLSGEDDASADEFDEIDLRNFIECPDEPRLFELEVNFMMHAEGDSGSYTQKTKNELGANRINFFLSKQGVDQIEQDIVPFIIEGQGGECTISGWGDISINVSGACQDDTASLDILGEFEFYKQTVQCPGKPSIDYTDSAFPAPSISWDFKMTENGDTASVKQDLGQFQMDYSWTLRALRPIEEEGVVDPVPITE